ncbi:MAG: Usg family protein [Oceanicaulis sp.]|nr:Usg family protein [Oceanicaulis sp.]
MERAMNGHDFAAQLRGARLTTAEVLYYRPDYPSLLQSFCWQTQDIAPDFPRLKAFLDHWRREIEAVIHSVRVAHVELVKPAEWRGAALMERLN